MKITRIAYLFSLLLVVYDACADQQMNSNTERSQTMTKQNESVPSVEALVPYQSAIASFKRKMPEDELLSFAITIISPAESYATMIQRELESNSAYGITVTVTPVRNSQTREVEFWRIYGLSKQIRLGDLSDAEHHAIAGWAFDLASYFQSQLQNFAYRL